MKRKTTYREGRRGGGARRRTHRRINKIKMKGGTFNNRDYNAFFNGVFSQFAEKFPDSMDFSAIKTRFEQYAKEKHDITDIDSLDEDKFEYIMKQFDDTFFHCFFDYSDTKTILNVRSMIGEILNIKRYTITPEQQEKCIKLLNLFCFVNTVSISETCMDTIRPHSVLYKNKPKYSLDFFRRMAGYKEKFSAKKLNEILSRSLAEAIRTNNKTRDQINDILFVFKHCFLNHINWSSIHESDESDEVKFTQFLDLAIQEGITSLTKKE